MKPIKQCLALATFIVIFPLLSPAFTVTQLSAVYQSGQVFLTWKNSPATNLKYKVYRSATKISTSAQLNASSYLGYVRDSSGKNIRKSILQSASIFFIIKSGNSPLTANKGLYVSTCTNNKKYFYAVTVVDLSTSIEDKTINPGSNSLSAGITEIKSIPQPVLQNTVTQPNGDIDYEYVQWGNNQDAEGYPAFNNCGSYGYNYTFINRNAVNGAPLFIKFQDNNPFTQADSGDCTYCAIVQLDDWLPNGSNTDWVGFNTNYDMYSQTNPVQTSGRVRTYTQNRVHEIIQWASAQPLVDPLRVYSSGFSHNGFGAMLTSILFPENIAATQETSSPIALKAFPGTDRETQWCSYFKDVSSDILNPQTGDTLPIWNVLDLPTMFHLNIGNSLPFMSGVNGKQDVTVGWVQYLLWYDSVNLNRQGGIWFWDQRIHTGTGKNFNVSETSLDFLRFSTNKSYPAFAYCSINENPGNGNVNDGDPYGAINGYLDWDDNSIIDNSCTYSINCFIKDFYVGSVLQTQYDSCTTDISLRRTQNFKPLNGQKIIWKVKNANNKVVQKGNFIFNDSLPPTIYAAKIYRTGSTLSFSISNCMKEEPSFADVSQMICIRSVDGYEISVTLPYRSKVSVVLSDLDGRIISSRNISMEAGINSFDIAFPNGIYLLQVKAEGFSTTRKLLF